jgi:hypothetical protein
MITDGLFGESHQVLPRSETPFDDVEAPYTAVNLGGSNANSHECECSFEKRGLVDRASGRTFTSLQLSGVSKSPLTF